MHECICVLCVCTRVYVKPVLQLFAVDKVDEHSLSNTERHACLAKKTKLIPY